MCNRFGEKEIIERRRYRYKPICDFKDLLTRKVLFDSGEHPVEIMELTSSPQFPGCQFHMELNLPAINNGERSNSKNNALTIQFKSKTNYIYWICPEANKKK